jgi:hypothetical protein
MLSFAVNSFAVQAEIPADSTAAIAKGSTQVTIGGEIRFRGTTYQNINDFNRNTSTVGDTSLGGGERQVYESRIRLSVEAKMSQNTIGFIQMESASTGVNFGENTAWGSEGCKSLGGTFKCGDVKSNEFRVMQAWIQHSGSGLFGVPAYIKVGHQPIVIGNGLFYRHNLSNDDAIVAGITPFKGLDITAVTVKLQENLQNSSDDQTLYSGIITYAFNKNIVVGADVSYLESRPGSLFPAPSNAYPMGVTSRLWNIGFNGKANIAGFTVRGEFDIQTGGDNFPNDSWKYNGYAVTLGASYTFAPVTLALDFGYGSGDSKRDQKVSTFLTAQSHVPYLTLVYDHLTSNAAGNFAGALQNTIFYRLSANADVMKNLNIAPSVTILQAAKKSFGSGIPDALVSGPNGGIATSSRNIGTEIDMVTTYQIDKGLKVYMENGYLFAGNFWKIPATGSASGKISDPWMTRLGFQLNF